MSVDQWLALDDEVSGELVDGALEEEEVPSDAHELVVAWLILTLGRWVLRRGGFVFSSERKLVVAPKRGRKPDISVHFDDTDGPPAIVIEVVTPTPRDTKCDRVDKPDDYAKLGVRFYWIIDPSMRTFEIWELGSRGRYERAVSAANGKLRVPGCPGLALDLDEAWAHLDRLARRRPAKRRH